jgi:hypothetical protein
LITASITWFGILLSDADNTYLISDGVIMPEPSLSNILNASASFSVVIMAFSLALATTNSV